MKRSLWKRMPRSAARLVAALGLALGVALGAQAQTPNSVAQPTPYSWPSFHAGGTTPNAVTPAIPGLPASPNLLAGQLQGTPSGIVGGSFNEIPSFLLGNWAPAIPPAANTINSPNNFRDALPFYILQWASPFTFTYPSSATTPAGTAALTVDDTPNPNFATTGAWVTEQDGTATNGEYQRFPVVAYDENQPNDGATGSAVWTLTAPADAPAATPPTTGAGFYTVVFHIPDSGNTVNNEATPEGRITDAHYVVRDTTAAQNVLADTTASQTESNSAEFLAGPFFLNAGEAITVTLYNTTKSAALANHYVVADSMSLQPGTGSDVQSPPTAISDTEYPEIHNALYYGAAGGKSTPDLDGTGNPRPWGNITLEANPATDSSSGSGAGLPSLRKIRQLVYFGRAENIILQDNLGNPIDANGNPLAAGAVPIVQRVGAIYCVNGANGEVVWRYQTPTPLAVHGAGPVTYSPSSPSAPVFSAPVVARINVAIPVYPALTPYTPTYIHTTKLVVIVGDNNGMIYCLDAIGDRDGTTNSTSVSPLAQPIYDPHPIFNPGSTAEYNPTGVPQVTPAPHVGNTEAYWIYRPDPNLPYPAGSKVDPTTNLPVPGSFGTASPVVYVDPDPAVNPNTLGVTNGNDVDNAALGSNAAVFIGNSNGVLYALDAMGGVPSKNEKFNASLAIDDPTAPDHVPIYPHVAPNTYSTLGGSEIPTCQPLWWFAIDGSQTSNSAAGNSGYERIVSAPAISASVSTATTTTLASAPTLAAALANVNVFVTSSDDADNEGRLYCVPGTGPVAWNGSATAPIAPGATGYNDSAQALWAFPHAYQRGANPIRPALGSITGSPVVFSNPDDHTTRIYFGAASGLELNPGDVTTGTNTGITRPGVDETGRIWSVNTDGTVAWAYPDANDPNAAGSYDASGNPTVEPQDPLGSFRFATPAIGMVQFPTVIDGYPVHPDSIRGDIKGAIVPMLYLGSAGNGTGQQGPRMYGIDLDGTNYTDRTVFYDDTNGAFVPGTTTPGVVSPAGNFDTSPALIVNSTTAGGNGGAVFVCSGATIYQFSATPVSSRATTPANPPAIFPVYSILTGIGPLSTPSVAAYLDTDLATTTFALPTIATDWVYFSDSGNGVAFGITPLYQSGGVGVVIQQSLPYNPVLGSFTLPGAPLFTYIFDGKAGHLATDTSMADSNKIGDPLPVFEWGENAYIRIGNVVPPLPAGSAPGGIPPYPSQYAVDYPSQTMVAADGSTQQTIVLGNGGPVTIQISDLDVGTNKAVQTDTGQVPAVILPAVNPLTPTAGSSAIPNGFFIRTDAPLVPGSDGYFQNPNEQLGVDETPPTGWVAAYTYAIRDGSARRNTPGSTRRVITATQVAQAYILNGTTLTPKQTVTLQTTITNGNEYTKSITVNGNGTASPVGIGAIYPVDQPTFGILNPLAIRAGGIPLFIGSNNGATQIGSDLGPFFGVGSTPVTADLPAYGNGNRFPASTTDVPANGVVTAANNKRTFKTRRAAVITSIGDVNNGSSGDNTNTKPNSLLHGTRTAGLVNATGTAIGTAFDQYAFDLADRSALGNDGLSLQNVTVSAESLRWNDNSITNGARNGGPGAMVNPLPWETMPHARGYGANTSLDYPNIAEKALGMTLFTQTGGQSDVTNQAATPDAAVPVTVGSLIDAEDRTILADPLKIQVDVPKYQPANLQLLDTGVPGTDANAQGPIPPGNIVPNNKEFPEGYVASQRVYVDSNHNGRYDDGEAYRPFKTLAGVPVDMSTSITNTTVDLGKLPQGFGLQTQGYAPLGYFMPYPTTQQIAVNVNNPGYSQFFKPLTITNNGNTNLLDVQFDQVVNKPNAQTGTYQQTPLPFVSDALDPLLANPAFPYSAAIPAYDPTTGASIVQPANLPVVNTIESPYLLRSSLDPDLVEAYGRNPGLATATSATGVALAPYYPAATFHKPRVGDSGPTTLTVPDVPHNNNAALIGNPNVVPNYNLLAINGVPPYIDNTTELVTKVQGAIIPAAAPPMIGLAIPQGTPVGTYVQSVQLFEGMDPTGYTNLTPGGSGTGTYSPLLPPLYSGQIVNPTVDATPPTPYTPGTLPTGLYLTNNNDQTVPIQPTSTPTVVKATVTEGRLTNASSRGSLPQIDSNSPGGIAPGAKLPVNFLPSALRNTYWNGGSIAGSNGINLFWSSSRQYVPGNTAPYNIYEALLPFNNNGAFAPSVANTSWWGLNAQLPFAANQGTNSGLTVAQEQEYDNGGTFSSSGHSYAFVQSINDKPPYQSRIYCLQIDTGTGSTDTGALTDSIPPDNAIPNFGADSRLVSSDVTQVKNGVKGLKISNSVSFTDPITPANPAINKDLWAFWYSGSHGRSAIYYSDASTDASSGKVNNDWSPSAVLPIPAGLASVSDPTANLITAPSPSGGAVPAIEVTYSGIAANGNADIYVSRYAPYVATIKDTNGTVTKQVNLAILAMPSITEQLQATDGNLWWQARDVAWARPSDPQPGAIGPLNVVVNGVSLLTPTSPSTFDRTTNTLVYPNVSYTDPVKGNIAITIYVDMARGRIRFSTPLLGNGTTPPVVFATFNPMARRITTDTRADTAPIAFIDETYKPNEANNAIKDGAGLSRVATDRYWFIWRKSGASGTSTTPTLWYKTQRLTVDLHVLNGAGVSVPLSVQLDKNGHPQVTVTDAAGTLYSPAAGGIADVDWSRGRIYFPMHDLDRSAMEGKTVTVTFDGVDKDGTKYANQTITDSVHWLDEPVANLSETTNVNNGVTTPSASATGESQIPIDTITNESNVSAFLDPFAYANTLGGPVAVPGDTNGPPYPEKPHKVWLFWNSTRNGSADLYYETIDPRFSATPGG